MAGLSSFSRGQFQHLMASQLSSRHPHLHSPPGLLRRAAGAGGIGGIGEPLSQSLSPSSTPPMKRGRSSDAGGESVKSVSFSCLCNVNNIVMMMMMMVVVMVVMMLVVVMMWW